MMFDQASATLSMDQDIAKVEQLADLTYEIGKDLLKKSDFHRASKWLQRAHDLLKGLNDEAIGPDTEELGLSVGHRLGVSAKTNNVSCV